MHSRPLGCLTKLGAKRAKLVQKFVPRTCVGIFRNEHTRSTPLVPKLMFWVQWGVSGALVAKNSPRHRGTNFCTRSARFHRVSEGNQTVLYAPKWYEMQQNLSLGPNGVDQVRSLRKILSQLRGTYFCTISAHFPPSFVRQPNGPECTQKVQNAPKRQFTVKWGGSGAWVVKNSDATSWHELLH